MRVLGLPLHMSDKIVLMATGDACGGFLGFDWETKKESHILWARMKLQVKGNTRPRWEFPPKNLDTKKISWADVVAKNQKVEIVVNPRVVR